jgi:hypothetical protein
VWWFFLLPIVENPTQLTENFLIHCGGGAAGENRIWFFERQNIPDAFKNNETSIDTSALGTPMGNWPAGGCNIDQFFLPQTLVFDITLCGGTYMSVQFVVEACV